MTQGCIIYHELERATSDAGIALSRTSQSWMFDRAEWFRLAAEHTLEGEPLVVNARQGGSACWLFLNRNGHAAHALGNWYCLRYGVVRQGPKPPFGKLVDGLRKAGISHLRLAPTGTERHLRKALTRRGWITRLEQINVSWRVDTRDMTFEEYWAGRTSRLRNTYRRKAKKAKLDCVIHSELDATIWAHVCDVFDNSWKKPDGNPELTFEMFQQEADAGTLRVGLAYKDGQPVAAQLWTVEEGVAIIHLLSYREDAKKLGAGTILSYEMFQHAIDVEKAALIDFGIGDHTYKQEWMTFSVPLYSLTAYHALSPSGIGAIGKLLGRKASAGFWRIIGNRDDHGTS